MNTERALGFAMGAVTMLAVWAWAGPHTLNVQVFLRGDDRGFEEHAPDEPAPSADPSVPDSEDYQ